MINVNTNKEKIEVTVEGTKTDILIEISTAVASIVEKFSYDLIKAETVIDEISNAAKSCLKDPNMKILDKEFKIISKD